MTGSFGLIRKFEEVERNHWWWNGRRKLVGLLIPCGEYLKILDVGCGTGETLSFLKKVKPNFKLYGIDSDPIAVGFSKSRNCGTVYKSFAEKLPFPDNYFDAVMFLDVLEHIKNQKKVLSESKRVLKRGGLIIITAPALKLLWSGHDTKQGHFRRYTRTEIRLLAKKSGLKLEFFSYFNFLLALPIVAIRVMSQFKPFNFLVSYNNRFNYDIAKNKPVNSLLTGIFSTEIGLIKIFHYPIGISVAAVLKKV